MIRALRRAMYILCGTDLTPASAGAAQWAASLARRLGDELVLAHVFEPPYWPDDPTHPHVLEWRRAASLRLEVDATALRSGDLRVSGQLVDGRPSEALLALARKINPRLVVLARHGGRAIERTLLGSVTKGLAVTTEHPLLLIPPTIRLPPPDRTIHACVGLPLGRDANIAVDFVQSLRDAMPLDVTFVHLYSPSDECARLGLDPHLAGSGEQVHEALDRTLREHIGIVRGQGGVELRIRPRSSEVDSSLAAEASFERADMLIVATHTRGMLSRLVHRSMARSLVREATMPLLIVPVVAPAVLRQPRPVRHVLCATDLSPVSNQAVPYAYSLTQAPGGLVELCHVHLPPVPRPLRPFIGIHDSLTQEERDDLERALRAEVPSGAAEKGIATRTTILEGEKADAAIVQAAERAGADVICLASHGRSGLGRALMGSVAQGILHKTDIPVFVVPISGASEQRPS